MTPKHYQGGAVGMIPADVEKHFGLFTNYGQMLEKELLRRSDIGQSLPLQSMPIEEYHMWELNEFAKMMRGERCLL